MATAASSLDILGIEQQRQLPFYAKRGISLVRGEGVYLYDDTGKKYLDAMSNYGVAVLGHADPEFAEAMTDQLNTLTTGHQSFGNDVRARFLEALAKIAPEGLTRSFLSNSGSEAIEAALKVARLGSGRLKFVAAKRAYHGRTLGALSATADAKYRKPFEPLPFPVTHVPFGDFDALEAETDGETAAVILEPVQGEAGIYPADDAYLNAVRELCDRQGVLLIADEIQSGFRTGAPFVTARAGIRVDILCTAKALANGFPIGLTMTTEALGSDLPGGSHGSTFGGNPLACRAGLFTLNALESRDLYASAERLGQRIIDEMESRQLSKVRSVRGRGLMIGIDLKERVTPSLRGLQKHGVLALPAGNLTLRLLPPMIWEDAQVNELLTAFEDVLA